jgi:dipeptidyl-peptidase 4
MNLLLAPRVALGALLVFASTMHLPAFAQGRRADYERSASLSKRIANTVFRDNVAPHWLPSGDAFWYRVTTGPKQAEFVFVDATEGEKRLAFDHTQLAQALGREQKTNIEAQNLPFTWIEPASDGAWVRFRAGGKVWQFDRDGTLKLTDATLNEDQLQPLRRPRRSNFTGEATAITFVNRTKAPFTLYWMDMDGNRKAYETVKAGESSYRTTFAGHVWLAVAKDEVLGAFEATGEDAQAIIEVPGSKPKQAAKTTEPKQAPAPQVEGKPAPKAPCRYSAFLRGYNVWVRDTQSKSESQLTGNGTKDNAYREPFWFSPDGMHLAVSQVVPEQEHKVFMVESSPKDQLQPRLKTINYLKPGDRVAIERPRLFDLATKREIPTSDELFRNPFGLSEEGWSADGQTFRFVFNQRGHQALRVIGMGLDGKVRALVDETSPTFVDYSQKTYLRWLENTRELIWASERDGWNHLYLYNAQTGQVKNQITKGEWVMREVERVDEENRQIWFRAFGLVPGQDPYYAHLARINFDGSGLQIFTEGDGTHRWKFSPNNRWIIDSWSRVDATRVWELRSAETGKLVTTLETADTRALMNAGWTLPERFEAPGRDGKTPIYGVIVRPSNFDPAKKYPVIENIYAGPHDFFTPKAFGTMNGDHELAELGFIVVHIDGMGTNWRSRAFHDVAWKNIKDAGFPDRIAWMKAAAQTRPWMDLEHVGVFGTSAGGQNALGALLFFGDFYKAAVSNCGCHDNRMDKIWWNEAWMGWPVDQSYEDSSNVVHAQNLRGKVQLVVGELDTNVDPASTLQVVDQFIKHDKDFELIVVPNGGHGAGGDYATRRQRDFFVRNLQGVEPRSQ